MERNQRLLAVDVLGHFLTGYASRLRRHQMKNDSSDEARIRRRIRYGSIVIVAWAIGYLFATLTE